MEVALACQNLLEVYKMTQEQLSSRIGKNRATIANYIRLLKLPAEIQVALKNRQIDMGHARALLAIDDPVKQLRLFHELTKYGYSVRMVEQKARQMNEGRMNRNKEKTDNTLAPLGRHLSRFLNAPVKFKTTASGKGSINISFKDEDDLARIMQLLDQLSK